MYGESIAITMFVMVINAVFFILPLKLNFHRNMFANLTIKRCLMIIATFLLIQNVGIMKVIAASGSLAIQNELNTYISLFGWGGYAMMIYLVIRTIIELLVMQSLEKTKGRME